jgi:hypothetical protein
VGTVHAVDIEFSLIEPFESAFQQEGFAVRAARGEYDDR